MTQTPWAFASVATSRCATLAFRFGLNFTSLKYLRSLSCFFLILNSVLSFKHTVLYRGKLTPNLILYIRMDHKISDCILNRKQHKNTQIVIVTTRFHPSSLSISQTCLLLIVLGIEEHRRHHPNRLF